MLLTSEQINELKKIDIEFVAEELGIPIKLHHSNCPFHEDDKQSLEFKPLEGIWSCPICHKSGDQIELIAKRYTLDRGESAELLADLMGVGYLSPYYKRFIEERIKVVALDKVKARKNAEEAERKRKEEALRKIQEEEKRRLEEERKRKEEEEKRKLQEEIIKREELAMRKRNLSYEVYSVNNIDTDILDFIVGRAQLCASSLDLLYNKLNLSKDIVKRFKIGSISRLNSLYNKLVDAFGPVRVQKCGLFAFDGGLKANFPLPALIIPFYDMTGHIGNLQFIKIDDFKNVRSFADKTQDLPFNLQILSNPNIKDVVFVNDIFDCLMLNSDGYNAFTLPSNFIVDKVIELLKEKNLSFAKRPGIFTLFSNTYMETYWKLKAVGIIPQIMRYDFASHVKSQFPN